MIKCLNWKYQNFIKLKRTTETTTEKTTEDNFFRPKIKRIMALGKADNSKQRTKYSVNIYACEDRGSF